MRNQQQAILFLTNFILYFTGNGLYPLLPLFAGGFGANQTTIGIFLASLSAANATGALLAGRLLARFSPRTLFVVFSALGIPALLLLTQARTLWLVVAATGLVWFSGGFISALLNVLTSLSAAPEARGRAFSHLFLASPLSAILGGAILGAVVSELGYTPGFIVLALLWTLIPVMGFRLAPGQSPDPVAAAHDDAPAPPQTAALGRSFYLLLAGALTVTVAINMRNIAAFLQMQAAGFSPAAVSSTTVVAGVVTIPVALFAGSLSDRFAARRAAGRRTLMMSTYLLLMLALIPLAGASELWHFSSAIALLLVATTVLRPGFTALAADLLPPAALQRGLPLVEASLTAVGIISAAAAGYLLDAVGPSALTLLSVSLVLLGAVALALLCKQPLVGAACPIPATTPATPALRAPHLPHPLPVTAPAVTTPVPAPAATTPITAPVRAPVGTP